MRVLEGSSLFYFLLITLFFSHFCQANYKNGQLSVGDVYNRAIHSSKAYKVFQLPSGVTITGMAFSSNNNQDELITAINYVACPQDDVCFDDQTALIATLQMQNLKVNKIFDVSSAASLGNFINEIHLPFEIDSEGCTYVLSDVSPQRVFMKIDTIAGKIMDFFPKNEDQFSQIIDGVVDYSNHRAFLLAVRSRNKTDHSTIYDTSELSILCLNISDMSVESVMSFNSSVNITISSTLTLNKRDHTIFLVAKGNTTGDHDVIYHVDVHSNSIQSSKVLPQLSDDSVSFLMVDHDNNHLFALSQSSDNSEKSQVLITRMHADSMRYMDNVTIQMRPFSGHFFSGNYLYLTSLGGELVRVGISPGLSDAGVMTMVTQRHSRSSYDPAIMPKVQVAKLYQNDTAYLASTGGILIQVNLTRFCLDTETCDTFIPPWLIVISVMLGLTLLFVGLSMGAIHYMFTVRRRKRFEEPFYATINIHSNEGSASSYFTTTTTEGGTVGEKSHLLSINNVEDNNPGSPRSFFRSFTTKN